MTHKLNKIQSYRFFKTLKSLYIHLIQDEEFLFMEKGVNMHFQNTQQDDVLTPL